MLEYLRKEDRMRELGEVGKPSLIVSLAEGDVPSLAPERSAERIQAAKQEGATVVDGGPDEIRATRMLEPDIDIGTIWRIGRATYTGFVVDDPLAYKVEAVGISYDLDGIPPSEPQRERLKAVRTEVDTYGNGILPVVVSLHSTLPPSEHRLERGLSTVKELGADIAIVESTADKSSVIGSSRIPVLLRISDRRLGSPLSTFQEVARAKDAGATGVVIGKLIYPQENGEPSFQRVLRGVRSVLDGQTPRAANIETTRSFR